LLDPQAKHAYRKRLNELREEHEEAQRLNDPGTATRARMEIAALEQQLSRALGIGGRARRKGSQAERTRARVTIAIKAALLRIRKHHPALGRHLSAMIRTGSFCSYGQGQERPPRWVV
jgi:hypothetical protein